MSEVIANLIFLIHQEGVVTVHQELTFSAQHGKIGHLICLQIDPGNAGEIIGRVRTVAIIGISKRAYTSE